MERKRGGETQSQRKMKKEKRKREEKDAYMRGQRVDGEVGLCWHSSYNINVPKVFKCNSLTSKVSSNALN